MCACDHELLIGYWSNLSQEQFITCRKLSHGATTLPLS